MGQSLKPACASSGLNLHASAEFIRGWMGEILFEKMTHLGVGMLSQQRVFVRGRKEVAGT